MSIDEDEWIQEEELMNAYIELSKIELEKFIGTLKGYYNRTLTAEEFRENLNIFIESLKKVLQDEDIGYFSDEDIKTLQEVHSLLEFYKDPSDSLATELEEARQLTEKYLSLLGRQTEIEEKKKKYPKTYDYKSKMEYYKSELNRYAEELSNGKRFSDLQIDNDAPFDYKTLSQLAKSDVYRYLMGASPEQLRNFETVEDKINYGMAQVIQLNQRLKEENDRKQREWEQWKLDQENKRIEQSSLWNRRRR